MKEEKQQNCKPKTAINKRKTLPHELLINIFREASNFFTHGLQFGNYPTTCFGQIELFLNKTTKGRQIITKYWYECATNLLTSSGIIYFYVGEYFAKAKESHRQSEYFSLIKALARNLEESSEDIVGDNIIAKGNKLVQEGKKLIEEGNKIKKKNISKKLLQDICSYVKPGSFMYESNREPESSATSSQVLVQKKKYIFVWELDNWVFLDKYHSQFLQIWDKLQRPLNLLLRNLFGISDFKSFNFTNILDVPTLENIGFRMPHSSSNVEHGTLNTSSNLRYMTEKLKQIQALYKYFKKLSLFEDLLKNCGINSAEFIKFFDNFETMPDVNILLYKESFNLVNEGGHQNVIVSNKTTCATIAGALGRLLLYRMGEHVEAENVYCIDNSLEFKQIIGKFQKDSIIIVTRNIETKQFAFQNRLPCWFITKNVDLLNLYNEIKFLVSQNVSILTGLPFKKLCEFCNKEIEKEIYLVHYIRCKYIHTTQVTSSSSPLAKKRRIDLNK